MKKATLPGFTAEDSIYRTDERYRMARACGSDLKLNSVTPALDSVIGCYKYYISACCDALDQGIFTC